jgi:hypothetical protein
MKSLILILFAFALCSASAQNVSAMPKSSATITNASVVTATMQTSVAYENVSIQAVVTKSTGTVAGTISVSASVDGANYISLTTSTVVLTDVATNSVIFPYTNNNYLYWKVTFAGAGTMVATPNAYILTNGGGVKRYANPMTSNVSLSSDTTTNTGTSYLTLPTTQWYNTVTVQSVVTKISGTVAGTVTLQGSNDGINYNTVNASYADAVSYSPTDQATNTRIFIITGSPYRYYRLSYTGAGTMSAYHRAYLLPNRK